MLEITPKIFLFPIIALTIIVICYAIISRSIDNKILFRKLIFTQTILGYALNFLWEILHSHLYQGYVYNMQHILFGALASVADVIMMLLLYFVFSFLLKDPYWVQKITIPRIILVILVGGTGTLISEMIHLSQGDWAYNPTMPIIPRVNVGLSPFLQFAILPLSIYWLSFYFLKVRASPPNYSKKFFI